MSYGVRLKGAGDSNPSRFKRWLQSKLMTYVISEGRQTRQRRNHESKRQKDGRRHVVKYFHQVDDGYSHLAIQMLGRLVEVYDIELEVHLVRGLRDNNFPEPRLLQDMSRWDSIGIAPYFGLSFPAADSLPPKNLTQLALSILATLDANAFATEGVAVSESLWRGDEAGLKAYAAKLGTASEQDVLERVERGTSCRDRLKHYSGAMFYYEGEWYWGVDRLCHLERRLRSLSVQRSGTRDLVAPRPHIITSFARDASHLTLEYYVSLRSPYTAISWEPTFALAHASGVALNVRPVLPMVMRGVPATYRKGFYVWKDAYREACDLGVEFGHFYDPVGRPVEQGYSLYMWALEQGRGNEWLGSFLKAAFAKGINSSSRSGMRQIVDMAGLDWEKARFHLNDGPWHEILEQNRKMMYGCGIWGVPSYRLLDRSGRPLVHVWGQDRLWLISRKIEEHA